MATKTPKIKHRVKVEISDGKYKYHGWRKDDIQEVTDHGSGLSVWLGNVPVPRAGAKTYTVTVEYLGERQYKQTYQQRVKALAASEKRTEKWKKQQAQEELERNEKQLVQRRQRIVNQIELAFVKKSQGAVDFITCDKCDAIATHLGLAYENPGSQVVDPDQITGAWCKEHEWRAVGGRMWALTAPFKTTAAVACETLEFFFDGLRQLCVKAAVK